MADLANPTPVPPPAPPHVPAPAPASRPNHQWLLTRAGGATACLVIFMVFLGYLAAFRTSQTNIGSAGATAITALLGAMVNPQSKADPTPSKFEVPRVVWVILLAVAFILTVMSAYLILRDAKYVNAAAGLLAGIAALGGLLVNPAGLLGKAE